MILALFVMAWRRHRRLLPATAALLVLVPFLARAERGGHAAQHGPLAEPVGHATDLDHAVVRAVVGING